MDVPDGVGELGDVKTVATPDTDHLKPVRGWRAVFTPRAQVLIWLGAGLIVNGAQVWLFQAIWIGTFLVLGAHAVWGGWVMMWLWGWAKRQSHWSALAMIVLFPAMWLLSDRIAFMAAKPSFDAVIGDIAAGRLEAMGGYGNVAHGVRYSFVEDRPSLIAFEWMRGIPDGGVAFVYDDRDSVGSVSSRDWSAAPSLSGLLVGQPESCERIAEPHYYMCDFS